MHIRSVVMIQFIFILYILLVPLLSLAQAALTISYIPTYGTEENISGFVTGVDFTSYVIAPYIYAGGGWWTKPTFAEPTVPLNPIDGTWTADITSHPNDVFSTRIAIFLIPDTQTPPQAAGESSLPQSIFSMALDWDVVFRGPESRYISFAGYQWRVKHSDEPVGPGPNLFSSDPADVWADDDGLHMSIVKREDIWFCTEVILDESFGYGSYLFQTGGRLDIIEAWMVAGFFTWDAYAIAPYREIDFEYSRWGDPEDTTNGQFVIQPYDTPGHLYRYRIDLTDIQQDLTHVLDWCPGRVQFRVYYGLYSIGDLSTQSPAIIWDYEASDVPNPGTENFRINFWLNATPPTSFASTTRFIVCDFQYEASITACSSSWFFY